MVSLQNPFQGNAAANNYLKHSEVTALLKNIKDCNGNANCINPLIQAATDLSNSRNSMDLLDPALAQDVAAGNILLQSTVNNTGTYGLFDVSSRMNDLFGINNTQQAKANAVPVLTASPTPIHPFYDSYQGQQTGNLQTGAVIAGATVLTAAGTGVLIDMGLAAQTTPLVGGVTAGQVVKSYVIGGLLTAAVHVATDPSATPASTTVNFLAGGVGGASKLGLNAAAGLANQWVPTTMGNLITYGTSWSASHLITNQNSTINQVISPNAGTSAWTSPVFTCGPYPRTPC